MLKTLFVLVLISHRGGVNTELQFQNMAQCEAAKAQILEVNTSRLKIVRATCIEMQIPVKKTNCRIVNKIHHLSRGALENFPYPVALECIEE